MFINNVISFLSITDKTIWQDVVLSSMLIPSVFFIFQAIKKWLINSRPIRRLLKDFLSPHTEVFIFLSQLSACEPVDTSRRAYKRSENQIYGASFPFPLPTDKNNVGYKHYQNIDPVWSESDGRCASDVFNLLGRAGKKDNIKISDTVKDWTRHNNPIFSIGFNPKTQDLENECQDIMYKYKDGNLSISGNDLVLDSVYPNDACIIQKSFIKNGSAPVFILAGIGTLGTEVSGHFLNKHCIDLGQLYGSKSFCVLLKINITKGKDYYEIKAVSPKPCLFRSVLYPITFRRWYTKKVFPK